MNMRSITILFCVLWGLQSSAQTVEPCGAGVIHENLLENDSVYHRSWFNFEQRMHAMQSSDAERNDDLYTIPVVIHVIHEGEPIGQGSNISDEQIFSAMTALNEDFRKITGSNGDGDGVDVNIEFCLAVRDPEGNSTTGINRVDGTVVPPYADEGIQANGNLGADEEAVKSLSIWPREDYMNVWVVNEIEDNNAQSGIQGFAYFPINSIRDGIIILHNAIGTVGNIKPNTALNRTLTHEVGHYLGLYHTFHTTTECGEEISCSTQGDRVCDTPPTILGGSCANPACDGSQQVENYMDYTAESCRNMFTQGQKDRMRATLLADRATILESLGCLAVTDLDCGITSIESPNGSSCDGAITPEVYLTNFGGNTLTSCDISYSIDYESTEVYNWNGSLASGESELVSLPLISTGGGAHVFYAWTDDPNGSTDQNEGNDNSESNFTISTGAGIVLEVTVDYFGSETTWEIHDNGSVVASGGPYINNQQGSVFEENICLGDGCYSLWMFDAYGDGMSFTNGSYALFDGEGNELVSGGGDFGLEIEHEFCVENTVTEEVPTASFAATNNSGCDTISVDFTDQSAGNPTSWSWSFPGGTPSTSSSPSPQNIVYDTPGDYNVTLTVSNGAGSDAVTQSALVSVGEGPTIGFFTVEPSCADENNGSISSEVEGNGPFTYDWSTGHSGTSISALSAGTYELTVTNANGCSSTSSTTLSAPEAIALNLSVSDISCAGLSDGSASVDAEGGEGILSIEWSTGANGNNIQSLAAGAYSIIVEDTNGCSVEEAFSIQEPAALEVAVNDFDISCDGAPGSAEVDIAGGNGPFSIEWSEGSTGNTVNGLNEGNYNVVVSDANGCSSAASFEITASESLNLSLDITEISCNGMSDGAAVVEVTGGNGDYTYTWSTGHSFTGISGRGPGEYSISVVDSEGCEGEASFTLVDPEALQLSVFKSDISCFGMEDGSASATGSGGSGALSYLWSDGQTGPVAEHLGAGNYDVALTDEHGCSVQEGLQIVQPSQISGSALMVNQETCSGMDGSAVINPMGGTGDLSIEWSNGQVGNSLSGVSAGTYEAIVSDSNGCLMTSSVEITYDCQEAPDPTELEAAYCGITDVTLDESIACIPVPGATMYNWRFVSVSAGLFAEEYTAGNNTTFMLQNVPGLAYDMSVEVSVRVLNSEEIWSDWGPACTLTMSNVVPVTQLIDSDCALGNVLTGSILHAEAIAGANSYEWEFVSEEETITLTSFLNMVTVDLNSGLTEGENYTVRVRSMVGDMWSPWGAECDLIFGSDNSTQNIDNEAVSILVYPNPGNGENISVIFRNLPPGSTVIELRVYDGSGKLVENKTLSVDPLQPEFTNVFQEKLSAGVYFLQIGLDTQVYEKKLMIR